MIKKSPLVRALMQVHKEYLNETHSLDMNLCAMCGLYRNIYAGDCGRCPMAQVFHRCGSRRCAPVNCKRIHPSTKKSKLYQQKHHAVQEFYQKTIARVRRMTVSELNQPHAFQFLVEIDKAVGDKYDLYRQ